MFTGNMIYGTAIILLLSFTSVYSSTCKPFEISKDNLNVALIGHSVLDTVGVNHHECARTCMSVTVCKSIDYNTWQKTCKLNDVDLSSVDPLEFETKEGSIFSDINEWPVTLVGSCSSNACGSNQRCYPSGGSYVCRDITCNVDQTIDNGKIQVNMLNENKFLDIASVKCDTGYVPSLAEVKCQASGQWQPVACYKATDCKEILDVNPGAKSGMYEIELWTSGTTLTVNCDMETAGGGWTIFQRRMDGSVEFYRSFSDYDNGFGNAEGELWLGLKYIQELAEQGTSEVRLDMTNENNGTGYETFQEFRLTDGTNYKLNIGSREGSAGNSAYGLLYHKFQRFSTFDRDFDSASNRNCAVDRHGGWWYNGCSYVNLNGLYVTPGGTCVLAGAESGTCGHLHIGFNGNKGLRRSTMMLRRT